MQDVIYADQSATAPLREEAFSAMLPWLKNQYGNPSSLYSLGREARGAIEDARSKVADVIGAKPSEIQFTSGGTEADNWVIKMVAEKEYYSKRGIYISRVEHAAVMNSCQTASRITPIRYIPVHEDGEIDSSALYMIKQDPALISVMTANNEVGTIEPIDAIAKECKRKGVLFHTDAVQAFGKIPIDVKKTPIDFMSISGHKIGAPKGIGALYIREGTRIEPLIDGGHQENGMRGGTENVAAIVGFGAACEVAKANMEKESERLTSLSEYLISNALSDIKGIHLTGSRHDRIPGHCSFVVDGVEGEVLQMLMDMDGICVSTGSACSSGTGTLSHVIKACGYTNEQANGIIRISFGQNSTKEDAVSVLASLDKNIDRIRKIGNILSLNS